MQPRQVKLAVLSTMIGISYLVLIIWCTSAVLFAEQKITVIPDAHSNTAVRFIDLTDYFLPVGAELTWFNDDFVDHKLVLTNEDNSTQLAEFDLVSNGSFIYTFKEPGKYYFYSNDYPKIRGSVRAIDPNDISTKKITGLKNNIDIQLTWTPSHIVLNPVRNVNSDMGDSEKDGGTQPGMANFIITFINNKTGTNQEHIDYRYTISNESGNDVFIQGLHSTYGAEVAKYRFEKPGKFSPQIMITHILFAPVDPDMAKFGNIIPGN